MENPFTSLIDSLRNRGAATGINQTSNTVKMAVYLLAPFIAGWIAVNTILPPELEDIATLAVFGIWLVAIALFYAKAKTASSSYLPFPQAHWFFPDGQQNSYDLMIPEKGYEKILEFADGSVIYRVNHNSLYYQEADRQFPDIWKFSLWRLPAEWNKAFERNGSGEFFFDNLFVTHPACENIQVTVIEWDERGSYRVPLCIITGCSYYAHKAREEIEKTAQELITTLAPIEAADVQLAYVADLKQTLREVKTRNAFLEDEHDDFVDNIPATVKEMSDDRLQRIQKWYGDIMYAKKSRFAKILNLKSLAIILVILSALATASHFISGWP